MFLDQWTMRRPAFIRLLALLALVMLPLYGCSDDNGGGAEDTGGTLVDTEDQDTTDTGQPDTADAEVDAEIEDDGGADVEPDAVDPPDADADGGGGEEDVGPVELRIDAVIPPRGPVDGGTPFVIEGAGFSTDTVVYFGSREAPVTRIDGNLVGETPEGAGVGAVNVKLLDPDMGQAVLNGGYTYTATVEVAGVSPSRVPTSGGVEVTVDGRGFDADTRVSFGGQTGVRHTLTDSSTMRVVTPPHAAGPVDVRVTNQDGTSVLPEALTYYEEIRIDQVRPASGAAAGGDTVVVEGAGFEDGMIVEFGGAPATVQSVGAGGGEATVTTPAGSAGLVDVRVESADGDAALLDDGFYYAAAADDFLVAGVDPDTGPASGGIEVTLIGAGLDRAGLSVEFGGQAATVNDTGPGHATVTIPAGSPGSVDVSIAEQGGDTDTLAQGFTYVDDLWINSVQPDESDVAGGATVTIEGEGFTGAQRVLFGELPAQFSVDSDTQITATAPARAAGVVDVVVERGIEARFVDGFTYTEALEVHGFSPVRGSVAGNTYVEVRGRGFLDGVDVDFGTEEAASVDILDAQTLAVRTPPHATGAVDVDVTRDADTVTAAEQYTYFNPGSRFGGSWGGPIQGAVNVTVYQMGGNPIEGAHVQLSTRNDTVYQGKTDANGMITLSGPDVYGEQTVTAVAAEYSSATVQYVNAENITIFLSQSSDGPPPPGPPTATFQGTIDGLDKIKQPGPNEIQMAIVRTTRPDPWSQVPDPGSGATVLTDGPYTLNSRIGDVALVAVGGLYNNATDTFEPLAMGVERYLFASEGQSYEVDLRLDIRLEESVTFKINNSAVDPNDPTSTPDNNRVVPWLDFGFEGVFGAGLFLVEGTSNMLECENLPPLTGALDGVSFFAIGGSYTGEGNPPFAEAFARDITDTSSVVQMPTLPAIAEVTSPANGDVPVDGLVSFQPTSPVAPNFYFAQVRTFMGATVWEAFIDGDATDFRFPDFPDFSHLPPEDRPVPYPGGSYQLLIFGINEQGTSIDNYSYSNLSLDAWDSYSVWTQVVSF
jgi:hypothetical protein